MKPFPILSAIALTAVLAAPAQAADPLSYDDPGMHFKAPAGFERVDLGAPSQDADESDTSRPAAVFVSNRGRRDQRSIVIEVHPGSDSLDAFEANAEQDLRKGNDSARVDKKEKTALANGMPAYFLRVSSGDGLEAIWRYEYVVVDGTRDIDVTYTAHQGEVDAQAAKDALASLYVVVYPHNR